MSGLSEQFIISINISHKVKTYKEPEIDEDEQME